MGISYILLHPAETWSQTGDGIGLGDFVLHPSLGAGFGYNTNLFYETKAEDPISVGLIDVSGGLSAQNRHTDQTQIKLTGRFNLQYFAFADQTTEAVRNRDGLQNFSFSARGDFLKRGILSFSLFENLSFSDIPVSDTATAGMERIYNTLGADLRFRPVRGEMVPLTVTLGYCLGFQSFLSADAGGTRGNFNSHLLKLGVNWHFFPKTSVVADVSLKYVDYDEPDFTVNEEPSSLDVPKDEPHEPQKTALKSTDRDAMPLRAMLGLHGLITDLVSVSIKGGVVRFYKFRPIAVEKNFPAVNAYVQYLLENSLNVKLSYQLDMGESSFSNYYTKHQIALAVEKMLSRNWGVTAQAAFDYYRYSYEGSPDELFDRYISAVRSKVQREDPVMRSELGLQYHLRQWLKASFSIKYEENFTDYYTPTKFIEEADYVAYQRFMLLLKLSGQY